MLKKITSECPGFRKGWDESVKECRDCLLHFQEEYYACKKSVEKRNIKITTVPFKENSVAFKLYSLLKEGMVLNEEGFAKEVHKFFPTQDLYQLKRQIAVYLSKWKAGTWNDKPLPFIVTKNDDGTYKITEV